MRRGAPIALFWLFYFAGLGVFFPYYSLYLRENAGLSGIHVGMVMSVIPLVGLMAQPMWGNVADRLGARSTVLAFLTAAAALGYYAISFVSGFAGILTATAVMALFATAVIPLSVSVALAALDQSGPHAFGLTRVWGTVGYLIAVASFPALLDWWQSTSPVSGVEGVSEPGLSLMFAVIAGASGAAALVGLWLPRDGSLRVRAKRGDWRILVAVRPAVALFAVVFLSFLFLQGPMALFPILVRSRGGDIETVGRLWVVMLMLEIPLIAASGAGLDRLGARAILTIGVVCGGIRWLVCGLETSTPIFYAVQVLHGVTVTGLMVGGPLYLDQVVPEKLRSTSQGMLAMCGIGAGGLISNVLTGWLIDHASPEMPYLLGGAGAVLLGLTLRWVLPKV